MSSTPLSPATDRESSSMQETAPSSPPSEINGNDGGGFKDELDEEMAGVNAAIDEMSREEGEDTASSKESKNVNGSGKKSQKTKKKGRKTKVQQKAAVEKEQKSQFESLEKLLNKSQQVSNTLEIQRKEASGQIEKLPKLAKGTQLHPFQIEGLTWLQDVFIQGLPGAILADEMGLGKTLQTISLIKLIKENAAPGPFLVVAPLTTLDNWVEEFKRWTPTLKVCKYHAKSKMEREEIFEKQLSSFREKESKSEKFPIVLTTYEIVIQDRLKLAIPKWQCLVIDEGHRLKNFKSRLMEVLVKFKPTFRLLLTGTPLQNNLSELWSLLHFIIPGVFRNAEAFESWFEFGDVQAEEGQKELIEAERKSQTIAKLHAILKPYMLRRVKADVIKDLPPKREYVLYATLMPAQREIYDQIKLGTIRDHLESKALKVIESRDTSGTTTPNKKKRKATNGTSTPNKSTKSSRASTPGTGGLSIRLRTSLGKKSYRELEEGDSLYQKEGDDSGVEELDEEAQAVADSKQRLAQAKKAVAGKKLQNMTMQLRQACNSPHIFHWPFGDDDPDETLVTESGKITLLDQLVPALISDGHKILIFSQFKGTLDILEEWAVTLRGWSACRLDGSIKDEDRKEQIDKFKNLEADIFFLSTRAGGQGINLVAADTVIIFDSDWNPQQDLQAQDRVHRIGQKKPVIVYRLATKDTVETDLLLQAAGKRTLEKLVIGKGKFRHRDQPEEEGDSIEELRRVLAERDGEEFQRAEQGNTLSERDLAILTDRSEEAFVKAAKGEAESGTAFQAIEIKPEGEGGILESLTK